jgi:branched-chain amino acid transport system permease protein
VRDNPERAEFVGYSTQRIRFQTFVLSAMFAGVAGALAAINFELMNSQAIGAGTSGQVLLMTFVGGVGHFAGPIIGAVLITFLQISLSDITKAWMLYFGLLFILVVMFSPGGIAGWLALHQPLLRGGRIVRLIPAYSLAAIPLAANLLTCLSRLRAADRSFGFLACPWMAQVSGPGCVRSCCFSAEHWACAPSGPA